MLRHVVLFAFKETATPTQLQAIEQAFADFPPQIDEIKGGKAAKACSMAWSWVGVTVSLKANRTTWRSTRRLG